MGDSSELSEHMGDTNVIELTGKIMVVAIIILFFVVVFVFCLHLYAKWFWYNRRQEATTTRRRRRRFDFAAAGQEPALASASNPGLDPSVLKTLTVVTFDPSAFKDGLECAVCLCEVSEGEKARLLPKCNHGFHLDCIDMWFESHSTCPLCRNPVAPNRERSNELIAESAVIPENNPSFPANVLFWGDESRVSSFGPCLDEDSNNNNNNQGGSDISEPSSSSSSSSGQRPDGMTLLVVDIRREMINEEEEEQKSPMPTRLRSLKRLLSGNRRAANPSSPRNLDLEQGNNRQQS